jgi:DnaJ-domain-containing protein 1
MDFELQLGAKLAHPQELTFVSDWGEIVQVTTLQLERRRVEAQQDTTMAFLPIIHPLSLGFLVQ